MTTKLKNQCLRSRANKSPRSKLECRPILPARSILQRTSRTTSLLPGRYCLGYWMRRTSSSLRASRGPPISVTGPSDERTHYPAGDPSVRITSSLHRATHIFRRLPRTKQTTILILATSHFSPLHSEVGSSAFSYVGYECSAISGAQSPSALTLNPPVKFLPLETASISKTDAWQSLSRTCACPSIDPRPGTCSICRPAEWLEGGRVLSPLWPRGVTRHTVCHRCLLHMIFAGRKGQRVRLSSSSHSHPINCVVLGVSHVVDRTLGPHACRIGDGGAWILTSTQVGRFSFTTGSWLVGVLA